MQVMELGFHALMMQPSTIITVWQQRTATMCHAGSVAGWSYRYTTLQSCNDIRSVPC